MKEAGTMSAAAETGLVKAFVVGAYAGIRRSKSLSVPSVEHVAIISGW